MDKNKLLLEKGFMGVNTKGSGKKPAPDNPGQVMWSEDDIIEMVYDVAPTIFRKSDKKWWVGTGYDEDDFTQDAVMYMIKKYNTNYIDVTSPNLKKIVYSLLNSFFIFNKAKSFKRKRTELDLDSTIGDPMLNPLGKLDFDEDYKDLIIDDNLNPEEEALLYSSIKNGKRIADNIIDGLSVVEFSSRKYTYRGSLAGKTVKFSEQSLAKLFLSGKTANEIIDIFNVDKKLSPNEAITITRKVNAVVNKIADIVNGLDKDARFDFKVYLYSIISGSSDFPKDEKELLAKNTGYKKV